MIHIYYGDGKGKTTCAFGLCLRAIGYDFNIVVAQFLKYRNSGEINSISKFKNVTILENKGKDLFTFQMNEEDKKEVKKNHNILFKKIIELTSDNSFILLDEIIDAINENLIDFSMVKTYLETNRNKTEIILTGRNPSKDLLSISDYVTEFKKIKHPFDNGVSMRKGIEF